MSEKVAKFFQEKIIEKCKIFNEKLIEKRKIFTKISKIAQILEFSAISERILMIIILSLKI